MPTILLSDEFDAWLSKLRDSRARARIAARIRSMSLGNLGDTEPVGGAVSELRIHYGPGYRLYYMRRGETVYLLLISGDKSSQKRDIRKALRMSEDLQGKRQ